MENTGVDKMQCNDDCNYDDRCCAQAAASVELAAELVPASTSCYCCIDASSLDVVQNKDITTMSTSFEPLKVCLDDDSSIEDSDDDMFDDDAFTFGDEEFQALMSHESMKRVTASIKSQLSLDRSAPNLSHMDAPNAHLPLHQSSSIDLDKAADSLPSTAASSQVRLPWLGIGVDC